jgi:hypothetical protein
MTGKKFRELMASASVRKFGSESAVDAWLDEKNLRDPTERIGMKHFLQSTGRWQPQGRTLSARLATDEAVTPGTLAIDRRRYTPEAAPVGREMMALLRKAGLSLQESYAETTVDEALTQAGLGVVDRVAVKHLLAEHHCLRR